MTVSVVLVTFNRAAQLGRTIESILAQSVSDFDLVICDDASPDSTHEVCQHYERQDRRVRTIRQSENVGVALNTNAGIEATTGDFVANLHDGDVYSPVFLERLLRSLGAYPNAGIAFNAYACLDATGQVTRIYRSDASATVPGSWLLENVLTRQPVLGFPIWGTVVARRAAYSKVGVFDPSFGVLADIDMWLRISEYFDLTYVDEPLMFLPSRTDLPHEFDLPYARQTQLLLEIYRKAIRRQLSAHPRDRYTALARLYSRALYRNAYLAGCVARRRAQAIPRRLRAHGGRVPGPASRI